MHKVHNATRGHARVAREFKIEREGQESPWQRGEEYGLETLEVFGMRARNDSRERRVGVLIALAACCSLALAGCPGWGDSADSTELDDPSHAAAPVVVLNRDGWEPPRLEESDILANRLLQRQDDGLVVDAAKRSSLSAEIDSTLTAIRAACPVLVDEKVTVRMTHAFGQLILALEPQLYEAVASLLVDQGGPVTLETGYAEFDSLNGRLGLSVVLDLYSFSRTVAFYFSEYLNVPAAATAYEMIDGIEYAEANAHVGDGPDIDAFNSEGRWYVVARRAEGDCPSGCINEELYFFIVDGTAVEIVDSQQALDQLEFSEIVMNQGWRTRSFEGC